MILPSYPNLYRVKIVEANLYVRKITVADHVLSAIEKILLKAPAFYWYTEVTSTREASHDFIHPEFRNGSISVELTFGIPLGDNVEVLFLGERSSNFTSTLNEKVQKNSFVTYPVDG